MESHGTEREPDQYLLDLAIYMASSARDVIRSKHYGTNRLLRSLARVLDLPNHIKDLEKDEFLERIRLELDEGMSLRKDDEALSAFLDELIVKMLKEYRNRLT